MSKNISTGDNHGTVTVVKGGIASTKVVDKVIVDGKQTADTTDPRNGVVQ